MAPLHIHFNQEKFDSILENVYWEIPSVILHARVVIEDSSAQHRTHSKVLELRNLFKVNDRRNHRHSIRQYLGRADGRVYSLAI